jgi:hypothetical protein
VKIIGLFEQFINERKIRDVLYHFTGITQLVDILKAGKMFGSLVVGSRIETKIGRGRLFYISFSRNMHGSSGYANSWADDGVRIILDKRSVSNHGKLVPVDYHGMSGVSKSFDEFEDRLLMKRNSIPNIAKHIISIHIYKQNSSGADDMATVLSMTTDAGIPVYVFNNRRAYDVGDISKAIDIPISGKVQDYPKPLTKNNMDRLIKVIAVLAYIDPDLESYFLDSMASNTDFQQWLSIRGYDNNWLSDSMDTAKDELINNYIHSYNAGSGVSAIQFVDTTNLNIKLIRRVKHPVMAIGLGMIAHTMKKYRLASIEDVFKKIP